MMDLRTIEHFQRQAQRRAARKKRKPHTLYSKESVGTDLRHATNLGDYCPSDWRWAKASDYDGLLPPYTYDAGKGRVLFFVSKLSGPAGGPALSQTELVVALEAIVEQAARRGVTLGLGIWEEGQFQCHLALYEKKEGANAAVA